VLGPDKPGPSVIPHYTIYLNRLYKFTTVKPAGPWDGSKVVPVSVAGELAQLYGNLFSMATGSITYGMNGIYVGKFDNGPVLEEYSSVLTNGIYIVSSNGGNTAAYVFAISQYGSGFLWFNRMNGDGSWQLKDWIKILSK